MTYPVHPAAELFPMMGAEALQALADDIKAHGQREPVILFDRKVLDGRNRLLACEMAGVEPRVVTMESDEIGSPTTFVLSLNLLRRHLDESQRAMVGAREAGREGFCFRQICRKQSAPGEKPAFTLPHRSLSRLAA